MQRTVIGTASSSAAPGPLHSRSSGRNISITVVPGAKPTPVSRPTALVASPPAVSAPCSWPCSVPTPRRPKLPPRVRPLAAARPPTTEPSSMPRYIISSSDGSDGSSTDGGGSPGVIHIRLAEMADYWAAADLHCRVFNTDVDKPSSWQGLSLRVDRINALQINDKIAREGGGNSALLLAFNGKATSTPEQRAEEEAAFRAAAQAAATRGSPTCADFPRPLFWLGGTLAPGVRPGIGISAESVGLVGVAAVDSFGDLVPPRELNWRTDGQMGWYRREGYAYVSNVAVLPSARRRGVARQLMAASELLAAEWGCRAVGLHCNPRKKAPWALYHRLGYRETGVVEPAIMPYLQGRPPDRCSFLLKLVPEWWRGQQEQRAPEEEQQQQQGKGKGHDGEGAEEQAGLLQPQL